MNSGKTTIQVSETNRDKIMDRKDRELTSADKVITQLLDFVTETEADP